MMSSVSVILQWLMGGPAVPRGRFGLVIRSGTAFAVVPAVTWLAFEAHLNLTSTSLLQLLAVLAIALRVGFWPAAIASVFANLCLNYFFVPPLFSLYIADPQNWIAICVFEISVLIVSRLSTQAQEDAAHAVSREREVERLYNFSLELLLLTREGSPGREIVDVIERIFGVETVALLDGFDERLYSAGLNGRDELEAEIRAAYFGKDEGLIQSGSNLIRRLHEGTQLLGSLGLRSQSLSPLTVDAISSLVSIALERARSMDRENQAKAERKVEQLRTAVLDALAHEYKTPLTALRAAASGLIEIGGLAPVQLDLVSLVDSEVSRLSSLTTRLVRMSRLDSAKVKPCTELIDANEFVDTVLANLRDVLRGHEIHVENLREEAFIKIDLEMVGLAFTQFIDNALKYSDQSRPITVSVSAAPCEVCLSVTNFGPYIPPEERTQLFQRFYRGVAASHKAPGNGLGLSISRKVADAHKGRVWVTSGKETGNTFSMALPRYSKEGL